MESDGRSEPLGEGSTILKQLEQEFERVKNQPRAALVERQGK
jgi:hypothetical protein